MYREIKISFNEEREVLAYNSPVFYRIKKQFSEGMKEVDHRVDLDKKCQILVKGWWEGKNSGARVLLNKLASKRSNVLHSIKMAMKGKLR